MSETTKINRRMRAYYYEFESTGCDPIDKILSAVACAGKAFHHTGDWYEKGRPYDDPYDDHTGETPIEWIYNAAKEASEEIKKLRAEIDRLKSENERLQLLDVLKTNFSSALLLAEQRAERSEAEVARLTAALKAIEQGDYYGCVSEVAGSAPSAVNPEPMCVWRNNLTLKQSGLYHEVFYIRCDGSHVQAVATDTPCFVCGKPIKFA